jgi:hypothetical protein
MDPFDTAAIRAGMQEDGTRKAEFLEWCVSALQGFAKAAQEVGTPVVSLEMDSLEAQASGVGLASWPTSLVDGQLVSQYYRIVRYDGPADWPWPTLDGRGLTQSLDGQLFANRTASNEDEVAAILGKITGYDPEKAKELFNAALRGESLAFG